MEEEKTIKTTVKKNQKADIPTKNGGKYSYSYVDIAQIHEYLQENNMRYIQKIERIENDDYIFTKRYVDGKWEDEWLQGSRVVQAVLMGNNNPAQEQGSALTYARRYSLLMAFGLATEDDDANSLNRNTIEKASEKQITMLENNLSDERIENLLTYYKIEKLEDLSKKDASEIIGKIFKK